MMGRKLSVKIASQIAHGLAYLHTMGITHADLKPANVLVFSKEILDPVNVKITDYGISRIVDASGNKGRVGTPGFRAPEIGHDLIFDKEADWFSYGRLLYQLFTCVSPSHYFQQDTQVKQIDEDASRGRFSFVRYTLQTSFPLFIALMRTCWRENPRDRPRDDRILSVLRDVSILALRHVIELDSFACSSPIVTTTPEDYKIHTWTGGALNARRRYQLLSADHGRPFAKSELHVGMPVKCVLQVGRYNLIGTTGREILVFECPTETNGAALNEARKLNLKATVASLYYQQNDFEEVGYVFAGLENGTTEVFQINSSEEPPEEWFLKSTLQLGDKSMSCNGFHPVRSGKELWVACGSTLRIINTSMIDLSVSPGVINVPADDNVSIDDSTGKQDIQSITGQQNKIWCSLKGSNKVLEYSTQSREKINVMSLQSNGQSETSDEITALEVVKDTLWVGKSTGEIVVVSIADKVVDVLDNDEVSAVGVLSLNRMLGQPRGSVFQIVRAGKDRILACMHYKDSERRGSDNGFLVVWESWGLDEFERFDKLQHTGSG
ncbi:leucine-rich repeat serine/threonine-protein kinase 1-like [Amphiura filiformis]|uniref:leucine-rich repeat serine/threonine-protein kinase 1-like n=1 Tax=Amphiura filiformis TaxID=82378 RepID=UPI003B2134B4